MNLVSNAIINIYSILILNVIRIHIARQDERMNLPHKLFNLIVYMTAILLMIDTLSRFDGHPGTYFVIVNHIGNFLLFFIDPILPSLCLLYVYSQVYQDEKISPKILYGIITVFIINFILLIVSQYNGCYYTIDSENVYHRGPLMPITIVVLLSTVFVSLYIIIKNKRNIERRYFIALIHFYAVPIVGTVLDIIFYGYSFILNSIAISLLIVLLHTKKRSSEMDYLTGLYNRKRLEAYLLYKIDSSSENRTFSAILIDMDNFKLINDTFGHDMGDDALETAAVLLKKSIRSDDFIARLGGDEFYIILNHSDRKSLELVVSRIKRCVEQYNESGVKPYKLHFSMGYDVYDYSLRQTMKEFQKRVDILMYENKQAKKIEK